MKFETTLFTVAFALLALISLPDGNEVQAESENADIATATVASVEGLIEETASNTSDVAAPVDLATLE